MTLENFGKPRYCQCGECFRMTTAEENKCCGRSPCFTQTKDFKELTVRKPGPVEIKPWVLKPTDKAKLRAAMYRMIADECSKNKWPPFDKEQPDVKTALPSCMVWSIRKMSEYKEDDGRYTGFPSENDLLQNVLAAHKDFRDEMKINYAAFNVINPKDGILTVISRVDQPKMKSLAAMLEYSGNNSWQEDSRNAMKVMLRMGIVTNVVAFEDYVHDALSQTLDVVYRFRPRGLTLGDFNNMMDVIKSSKEHEMDENGRNFDDWKRYWMEIFKGAIGKKDCSREEIGVVQAVLAFCKKSGLSKLSNSTIHTIKETLTRIFTFLNNDQMKISVEKLIEHCAKGKTWEMNVLAEGQPPNEHVYEMQTNDFRTLCYLSNIFFGIRCIFVHGNESQTVEKGVLKSAFIHTPAVKEGFKITVGAHGDAAENKRVAEEYLFNLCQEAKNKRKDMEIDFDLYKNTCLFYEYLVKVIGEVCAYLAFAALDDDLNYADDNEVCGLSVQQIKAAKEVLKTGNSQ